MATAVGLPTEILLDCFEESIESPAWEPDRRKSHKCLLDYALVCRGWTGAAQALLFRAVRFPENEDGPEQGVRPLVLRLKQTLDAHERRGSKLAEKIQSLALTVGVAPSFDYEARVDVDAIGCDLPLLVDMLGKLTNLHHLELNASTGWVDRDKYLADPAKAHLVRETFTADEMTALKGVKGSKDRKGVQNLKALTLKLSEFDMPLFAQLLAAFPALTYLDLTGTYHVSFAPNDAAGAPGAADLSNLGSLRELRASSATVAAEFAARVGPNDLHVETLHVGQLPGLPAIKAYKEHLRRLVVSDWSRMRQPDAAAGTEGDRTFPRLTELVFTGSGFHGSQTVLTALVGLSPVRHFGLQFEPTRLVSCRELVKLYEDVLGPPGANKSVKSATVYSSSIPFYLHPLVPEEDALKQFRETRDFPIQWSDDAELMGIPGLRI
ncbi:hypothetical protein AURDEDRAFT_111979 [Auricularia subglabra TFB-10046 SS5]|nr:hypothetical protein AURDEDRAFT_111979 [Auricularia subglabra TFB-10046 SS5]